VFWVVLHWFFLCFFGFSPLFSVVFSRFCLRYASLIFLFSPLLVYAGFLLRFSPIPPSFPPVLPPGVAFCPAFIRPEVDRRCNGWQ
jgi:hypothetical protein